MTTSVAMSTKATLRAEALGRRDALAAEMRAAASLAIAERAIALLLAEQPTSVAGYMPIRSEADPRPLLDRLAAAGIALCLPAAVDRTTIIFRRYEPGDALVPGPFGTRAPGADKVAIRPGLVIVPLVAFDRAGMRLGYGLGFYDRAIAELRADGSRPGLVGMAFAVQEVAAIPAEPHDAALDWIVTEDETLDLRRGK